MLKDQIKSLNDIKNALMELINSSKSPTTSSGGDNQSQSTLKVSQDYQVLLDLLVNFPLKYSVLPEEIFRFITSTNWMQCVSDNANGFRLINTLHLGTKFQVPVIYNTSDKLLYKVCDQDDMKFMLKSNTKTLPSYNNIISNKDILDKFKAKSSSSVSEIPIENKNVSIALSKLKGRLCGPTANPKYAHLMYFDSRDYGILDPRLYDYFMKATPMFKYDIQKFPFRVSNGTTNETVATSNHIFNKTESQYDIIIYPDRIVYLSGGRLNDNCQFKVFELPTLQVLETGSGNKIDVYSKLKLTRKDIIGPNIVKSFNRREIPYDTCTVQYGFRVHNGLLYDIFMNSIRVAESNSLKYKTFEHGDDIYLLYY